MKVEVNGVWLFSHYTSLKHIMAAALEEAGDVLIKKWRMLVKEIRVDILVALKVEVNDGDVRNREKKKEEEGARRFLKMTHFLKEVWCLFF